eukprot:15884710-Heterocapsa_arctica.AAC.1
MLEEFGYTSNCARCRGLLGSGPPPTRAHEPHCRKSLEAKLAEDDNFKEKLAGTKCRLEEHTTDTGEERASLGFLQRIGTPTTPHRR